MVKIEKYTLEQLAKVKPVLGYEEKKCMIGGYRETYDGFLIFTGTEIKDAFQNTIPDDFGPGISGYTSIEGNIKKQDLMFKVSRSQYNAIIENFEQTQGSNSNSSSGSGSGSGSGLHPASSTDAPCCWPYTGTPNPSYIYDPFAPIGSYSHPYSLSVYNQMVDNATWKGGCVEQTSGYMCMGVVSFAESGQSMTYGDYLANKNGVISSLFNTGISSVTGALGVGYSLFGVVIAQLSDQMKSDLSKNCTFNSKIYVTGSANISEDNIYSFKVYNAQTGDLMAGYSITNSLGFRRL